MRWVCVQAKRGLCFCQGDTGNAAAFILEQRQVAQQQKQK